jgi:hypothetical protein
MDGIHEVMDNARWYIATRYNETTDKATTDKATRDKATRDKATRDNGSAARSALFCCLSHQSFCFTLS